MKKRWGWRCGPAELKCLQLYKVEVVQTYAYICAHVIRMLCILSLPAVELYSFALLVAPSPTCEAASRCENRHTAQRSVETDAALYPAYLCLVLLGQHIDTGKLTLPPTGIQKRPQVKSVIIRRVALSVVGWSKRGCLVAVDAVVEEESLHLSRGRR